MVGVAEGEAVRDGCRGGFGGGGGGAVIAAGTGGLGVEGGEEVALLVWCASCSITFGLGKGMVRREERNRCDGGGGGGWRSVDAPRMISCFSARSLPRETSSSRDSHIPFEFVSLVPDFRPVVPPLYVCPWGKGVLCMLIIVDVASPP